jgi:NADH dehydrogenase
MEPHKQLPRVVIVGAGFGGLRLARTLRKVPVEVLLIDRNNYHTFQPLLYQVATAGLEPEEIAHTVRGIFQRHPRFRFRLGTVVGVDWPARAVLMDDGGRIAFDYLVLAAGAVTNYFGVPGAEAHSRSLKSLTEAVNLRSHLIAQFERVDQDPSLIERGVLNFAVVGGGPTGIETAGALIELFEKVLRKDYPRLPLDQARVLLIEAGPNLLDAFHADSQAHALKTLKRRGVTVHLGDPVVRVSEGAVHLKSGTVIPTATLIWSAGIRAHPLADALGLEQTRGGRLVVEPTLQLPGRPGVFAIGDLAGSTDAEGRLHPQVAQLALQGATHVTEQIRHLLSGRPLEAFRYRDKGIMATIGRNSAVAELAFGWRTRGFLAWVMWLVLHLVMLIGFRNRLNVLVNWAWNYFTYDRSARLILGATQGAEPEPAEEPVPAEEPAPAEEDRVPASSFTPNPS